MENFSNKFSTLLCNNSRTVNSRSPSASSNVKEISKRTTVTIDDFERLSLIELWQVCDQNAMQLMNLIHEFIGRRTGHIEHSAIEREKEQNIEVWRDYSCALKQTDNKFTSIDHIDKSGETNLNQTKLITDKANDDLNNSNVCTKILNKNLKIVNLIENKVQNNKELNLGTQCDNSIEIGQKNQQNQQNVIELKCNQLKIDRNNDLKKIQTEDSYNGADIYDLKTKRLLYSWSQNLSELDLTIPICLMDKNQCKISIKSNSLTVLVKEEKTNNWITHIDGEMVYSIRSNSAFWTLESGKAIRIFLEKEQDRWWSNFLKNEPELDLNKLEKTIPYDQLTIEEQNVIQQLAYQQKDKKIE